MGGSASTGSKYAYGNTSHLNPDGGLAWIGKTLDLPPKPFAVDAHFELGVVLGTGMLGCVRLVQHKKTKKYYALKSMKKSDVIKENMARHIENERDAFVKLTKLQHPFLAKYFGSLQSPAHVHLFLEYVPGGELLRHLHRQPQHRFSIEEAKFYATELVTFVTFMHTQNVMYRDLKPENVLLDAEGHIKVIDLGFVRSFVDLNERCLTSVGTPQYLAPEQLTQSREKRGYTSIVDWWALACMIFEMVSGRTPFNGGSKESDSPFEVYTRIVQGKIQWPRVIPSSLKDLLQCMLSPDITVRLCDPGLIQQHVWFKNVDWTEVPRKEIDPPIRPMISESEGDHSNFDSDVRKDKETFGVGKGTPMPEFHNF